MATIEESQEEIPPPLKLKDDHSGAWECGVCSETYDSASGKPWTTATGDLVCGACVKGLFTRAIASERYWPARWTNVVLDIRKFESLFDGDETFMYWYLDREKEVEAERQQRAKEVEEGKVEEPEGLVRGKDYQLCPRCHEGIILKDGCNHVECRCGQNFCYICGKEAFDRLGSNHWAAGGCPRYHSAGSANAIYDPDDDDEEDVLQLSFDTWAWNMAMQHSDPTMQADMRRILRHTLEDQTPPIPTLQNVRDVLRGLETYHVEHGVDPTEWASLVDEYRGDTILRVTRAPAQNTLFQNTSPVRYGVLSRPVGGVFNLASDIGQSSAHSWAGRVWRAYGAETRESFENYAVFDFGPGGDLAYREAVAEVIDILRTQGHMLTNGRLAFDAIPMSGNAILVEITGQRPIFEDDHPALPGFSDMNNPLTPLMVFISNPTVLEGHEDLFQRRLQDIERAVEIVRAEAADRATERLRLELHRLDAHILNLDSMTDLEMEAEIDIWRRVRAEPLPEHTSSPLFEEQHFAQSVESAPGPALSLPAQPLADADEWLAEMTRFEQILLEDPRQAGGEQHQRNNPYLVNGADLIDVGAHPEQAQMEPRSWQELADSANRIALPEGQQEDSGDSSEETGWGLQELADRTNNVAQDDRQEDAGGEDGSAQAISWMELADQANEIGREDADVEEAIDRFLGLFDEPGDELLNDGVAGGEAR